MGEQREGVLADLSIELSAEARRLAAGVGAAVEVILFGGRDDVIETLGRQGPNAVRRIAAEGLDAQDPARAAAVLERLVRSGTPRFVLFGATRLGNELAARLAARLDVGLLSRCTRIEIGPDGQLRGERSVYAGRATAALAGLGRSPTLATVLPGVLAASRGTFACSPAVQEVPIPSRLACVAPPLRVEGAWQVSPWEMDLEEAETIVAGGLGLATRADFEMLAELAGVLGGAVGASRPVVDAGVVPYHRQVGISGRIVRPRLYVACAISGSVHHVAGMKGSGAVIAINSDPYAPIFEVADLAIVGDAREIVPALLAKLRGSDALDAHAAQPAGILAAGGKGAPA